VGHAGHPALHRLLTRDLAIGAKRAESSLHERRRPPDPSGRVEYEPLDLAAILRAVCRHRDGAPRPADQIEARDIASREDEINDRADILHRSVPTHDWRGRLWVIRHFLRAWGFAIAAQIEKLNVVSARGDVVHPRHSAELEVEGRAGRIGRSMHVEYRALGTERGHVGRVLVAHVDLDPRIGGFHHHLFGDEACLCHCGGREHGGGSDNAKRKRVHFTILPSIVQALPTRRGGGSACRASGLMSIHNSYAAPPTNPELPALRIPPRKSTSPCPPP